MPVDRRLAGAAAVALAALAALSASGQDPAPNRPAAAAPSAGPRAPARSAPSPAPATTTTEPSTEAAFTVGTVDVQAVEAEAELPSAARAGVQTLLDRYLTNAVVTPLRSGQPAGDLSSIFGGAALERMNGPDRAALVDEGLPRVAQLKVSAAEADLTALLGPDGVAVMAAGIKLVVTGAVDGAPLTVERTGELLLGADGDSWRVTGYHVRVTRDAAGAVTTTTVRR
ncbi:MAG: hypothetical protein ACRD2W_00700 [Acidimicrobiales bacterium]